jgi:hypothetical protein
MIDRAMVDPLARPEMEKPGPSVGQSASVAMINASVVPNADHFEEPALQIGPRAAIDP